MSVRSSQGTNSSPAVEAACSGGRAASRWRAGDEARARPRGRGWPASVSNHRCCLGTQLCVDCLALGPLGNLLPWQYPSLPFHAVARLIIFTHAFLCAVRRSSTLGRAGLPFSKVHHFIFGLARNCSSEYVSSWDWSVK